MEDLFHDECHNNIDSQLLLIQFLQATAGDYSLQSDNDPFNASKNPSLPITSKCNVMDFSRHEAEQSFPFTSSTSPLHAQQLSSRNKDTLKQHQHQHQNQHYQHQYQHQHQDGQYPPLFVGYDDSGNYPQELFPWAFYPYQLTPVNPMDEFISSGSRNKLGDIAKRSNTKMVTYSSCLYQFMRIKDWDDLFVFRVSETEQPVKLDDGSHTLVVERINSQKAYSERSTNCAEYTDLMQTLQNHRHCETRSLPSGGYHTESVGFCVAYPDGMVQQMYLSPAATKFMWNPLSHLYKFLSWPEDDTTFTSQERISRAMQFDSPVIIGELADGVKICMIYNMNTCGRMIEPFNKIATQIMAYTCTTDDPCVYLGSASNFENQAKYVEDVVSHSQPYLKYPTGPVVIFACRDSKINGNPLEIVPYALGDFLSFYDSFSARDPSVFPVNGLATLMRSKMSCFRATDYDRVTFSRFIYEHLSSVVAEDLHLYKSICTLFESYGNNSPFVSGRYPITTTTANTTIRRSFMNPQCAIRALLSGVISLELEDRIYFPIQRTRDEIWTEHQKFPCNVILGKSCTNSIIGATKTVRSSAIRTPPLPSAPILSTNPPDHNSSSILQNDITIPQTEQSSFAEVSRREQPRSPRSHHEQQQQQQQQQQNGNVSLRNSSGSLAAFPISINSRTRANGRRPPLFSGSPRTSIRKSKDNIPTNNLVSPINVDVEIIPPVTTVVVVESRPKEVVNIPDHSCTDTTIGSKTLPSLSTQDRRSRSVLELTKMVKSHGTNAITKKNFPKFASVLGWLLKTRATAPESMSRQQQELCKFCVDNLKLIRECDPRSATISGGEKVCGKKRTKPTTTQDNTPPTAKVRKITKNTNPHKKRSN